MKIKLRMWKRNIQAKSTLKPNGIEIKLKTQTKYNNLKSSDSENN